MYYNTPSSSDSPSTTAWKLTAQKPEVLMSIFVQKCESANYERSVMAMFKGTTRASLQGVHLLKAHATGREEFEEQSQDGSYRLAE